MRAILIATVLAATPALAQQPQQRVTALQILQSQVGALAGQNASCVEQAAGLQEQLAAAQARIKELEASRPNSAPEMSPPR